MSGRLSRFLTIAHLLKISEDGMPGEASASRGIPVRARRIGPAATPAVARSAAPPRTATAAPQSHIEEDAEEEMRSDSPEAQARRRERARCAAILTSAGGLKLPELAYALAFRTRLSRRESLAVLADATEPSTSRWAHLKPMQATASAIQRPRPRARTLN